MFSVTTSPIGEYLISKALTTCLLEKAHFKLMKKNKFAQSILIPLIGFVSNVLVLPVLLVKLFVIYLVTIFRKLKSLFWPIVSSSALQPFFLWSTFYNFSKILYTSQIAMYNCAQKLKKTNYKLGG